MPGLMNRIIDLGVGIGLGIVARVLIERNERFAAAEEDTNTAAIEEEEPTPTTDAIGSEIPALHGDAHGGAVYLDWNATSPVFPEVTAEMMPFTATHFGNRMPRPSQLRLQASTLKPNKALQSACNPHTLGHLPTTVHSVVGFAVFSAMQGCGGSRTEPSCKNAAL